MDFSGFLNDNQDFSLFGPQHQVILVLLLLGSILLPYLAKRYMNPKQQLWLARFMAASIAFWVLAYVFILMGQGKFNYKTDLPLDICNITGLALPFLMWNPKYKYHEVLYFWILAGTMQAILTPHLYQGFPNFVFIKYWWVHVGLVVYAIYITRVYGYNPKASSILKAFVSLLIYVLIIFGINAVLGSNYVYVMHKPPTASALDYLGPWPFYLIFATLIGLLFFVIMYIPIWAWEKRRVKQG